MHLSPVEFASKVEDTTIFYQAIEIVVNCICNRFQLKETLLTMEILLLKALCEEDFGHEIQQRS